MEIQYIYLTDSDAANTIAVVNMSFKDCICLNKTSNLKPLINIILAASLSSVHKNNDLTESEFCYLPRVQLWLFPIAIYEILSFCFSQADSSLHSWASCVACEHSMPSRQGAAKSVRIAPVSYG